MKVGTIRTSIVVVALVTAACEGPADPGGTPETPPDVTVSETTKDGGPSRTPAPKDTARDDASAPEPRSAGRFATSVVSFTPGRCAGFGAESMPGIVLGPPRGGGSAKGSLDVLSLGTGGEIVLSFAPSVVVDGEGPDLIVFENAFLPAGDTRPYAEPGEVSVSEDGVTWKTFACTATAPLWGTCAGWHPVLSTPESGISPFDPTVAGGDAFDLADVGLARARFVRIKDRTTQRCASQGPNINGFDLDAIAAIHAEDP